MSAEECKFTASALYRGESKSTEYQIDKSITLKNYGIRNVQSLSWSTPNNQLDFD